MAKVNRIITAEDRENAQRLYAIWSAYKARTKATQADLAKMMGFSGQAVVSQFLNCAVAMNTDVIIRFARILGVDPEKIDPRLAGIKITTTQLHTRSVPIIATLSGQRLSALATIEIATSMEKELYAVAVDTDGFEPYAKKGSTLIVSQDEDPISGDEVFMRVKVAGATTHTVRVYVTTDLERNVAVTRTLSGETLETDLEHIELMDPIVAIERPQVARPQRCKA